MKRKIALLLLTVMTITLVGCGEKDNTTNNTTNDNQTVEDNNGDNEDTEGNTDANTDEDANTGSGTMTADSAVGILQTAWNSYGENDKFPVGGGDSANMVMDEPGTFDVTNTEELNATLGFPTDYADKIDEAASLIHMMNANTFTGSAYHVVNADDVTGVADALKENILQREWMCGFPETLLIMQVDDNYIVTAFGNGEMIQTFKSNVTGSFANVSVLYEVPIE